MLKEDSVGEKLSMADWCKKLNLNYSAIKSRISRGWTAHEAFNTPKNVKREELLVF